MQNLIDWNKPIIGTNHSPATFVRQLIHLNRRFLVICNDGFQEYPAVVDEYGSGQVINKKEFRETTIWINVFEYKIVCHVSRENATTDGNLASSKLLSCIEMPLKLEIGRFDV